MSVAAVMAIVGTATGAAQPPSATEIVRKWLAAHASTPKITVADATLALRAKIPVTAPPTCAYAGKITSTGARYDITIERETRGGVFCGIAARYRENLLEVVRETMETVAPLSEQAQALALRLDQFDFYVRDQKVKSVGEHTHWFYLIEGKAKGPNHDPQAVRGWIDYNLGLWEEGTLTYSWGKVDTKQKFTRLHDAWILTYQYLYSKQYDASLQTVFSNFQFSP